MNRAGFSRKATVVAFLTFALASIVYSPIVSAQEAAAGAAGAAPASVVHLLGVALGLGMIVIGAGLGIGKLAAAAAEGIARQPSAAAQITGAVNLPLFLLEGVAILAEVFALLVLLLANPIG
jgi:F-type H+-transporting ATPase subunit c